MIMTGMGEETNSSNLSYKYLDIYKIVKMVLSVIM